MGKMSRGLNIKDRPPETRTLATVDWREETARLWDIPGDKKR